MIDAIHAMTSSVRKNIFFLAAFTLLCGCCLFADGFPLNDSDIESKWFTAISLSAILCVVSVCKAWKEKRLFVLRQSDIIVSVLLLYIAARSLSGTSFLFWLRLSFVTLLYVSFRLTDDNSLEALVAIVTLLCTVLASWGIGQWLHLLPEGARGFPVVGNFDNPSGYASALAVGFSFALSFARGQKGIARVAALLSTAAIVFAVIVSGSRAGLFAIAVILLSLLASRLKVKRPTFCFAACSIVLLALLTALYFLKRDSADGRFFIWIVSSRLVARHPLFGGGSGAFMRDYMPEQAAFFRAHPDSRFALLADDVSHPFNEYLSLLIQWGLIGTLLCLALAVIIVKAWKKNQTQTCTVLMSALLALGVFALFSYPMNYPFGWLVLVMAVGVVGRFTPEVHALKSHPALISSVVLFPVMCVLCASIIQYGNYSQWHALCLHRPNVAPEVLHEGYEALYPFLYSEPLFLYNYAAEMHKLKCDEIASILVIKCHARRDDYVVEHLLGDIQKSLGRREEAFAAYETMSCMCPNRFIPLYQLFQLAVEDGDTEKANLLAKEIVQKPVKVESPQIDFIKARCKIFINK